MRKILNILAMLFSMNAFGQLDLDFMTEDSVYEGCVPFTTQFIDRSSIQPDEAKYFWIIGETGDTIVGEGKNEPVYIFSDSGIYSITLIIHALDGSSRDTLIKENYITVGAHPEVDFELLSTQRGCINHEACFADSTKFWHAPLAEWLWDFGNGKTSTDQNDCVNYAESTNASISLTVTDSLGCSSTTSKQISFDLTASIPRIDIDIDHKLGCDFNHEISAINNTTGNGSIDFMDFIWNFGEDSDHRDSSFQPSYTYLDTGEYDITLNVVDSLGCKRSKYLRDFVKIRILEADFDYELIDSCDPFTFKFIDTSSFYTTNWDWNFGDSNTSNAINPIHTFSDTGLFKTLLTITDDYQCEDTMSVFFDIRQTFYADFASDTLLGCDTPYIVNFNNQSLNADASIWNFGNGALDTITNPSYTYKENGLFNITLTVIDSIGCSHSKSVDNMIIVEHFNIDFDTSSNSYCSPGLLYADLTTPAPNQWKWDFGDDEPVPTQNFSYTFPDSGDYPVTLYTYGNYCNDTLTKNIRIDEPPLLYADFQSDIQLACDTPTLVNFTDQSINGDSYSWEFGDNKFSVDSNVTHTYTNSGHMTVSLTIQDTNLNCFDTRTRYKYIKVSKPFKDFLVNVNCDTSRYISVEDTNSHANQWSWNMNDGNNYDSASIDHQYLAFGTYNIQLTVSDTFTNCSANKSISVNTDQISTAINVDAINCFSDTLIFNNTSVNADSFLWNLGDNNIDNSLSNFEYHFELPGLYTVYLTAFNDYCSTTDSLVDLTIQGAKASFNFDLDCDSPKSITFEDSSIAATNYFWNFGDDDSSVLKNPIHQFEDEGIYTVSLTSTNTNTGCIDTYTDTIIIIVPIAKFSANDSAAICFGNDSLVFADESNIAESWLWNFGDGGSSTNQNPKYLYSDTGNYDVQLIITTNGICTDTIIKEDYFTIKGPISSFENSIECETPYSVQFNDNSKLAQTYAWTFGDGASSSEENPRYTYSERGAFKVTLTTTNNDLACSNTYSDTVLITEIIASAAVSDSLVCYGTDVQFLDLSQDAIEWKWFFNAEDTIIEQQPTYLYDELGLQSITLEVRDTNNCLARADFDNIVRILGPKAAFDDLHDCVDHYKVTFDNLSEDADENIWSFQDGVISYELEPEHTYGAYAIYPVELKTVNYTTGCANTFTKDVFVFEPTAQFTAATQKSCAGVDVSFTDLSLFGIQWWWDFSGFDTVRNQNPIHAFQSDGLFDVQLSYKDTNGCFDTIIKEDFIEVNKNPVVNFVADATSGCMPLEVNFTDQSTSDTTITSWYWEFDQLGSNSQQHPNQSFFNFQKNGGGYTDVRLRVINANGCLADTTFKDYIFHTSPYLLYFVDQYYCLNDSLSLENKSRGWDVDYQWKIGESNFNGYNPEFIFDSAGVYEFLLIGTDVNNCIDTNTYTNHIVVDNPVANFGAISETDKFCPPILVYFNDSSQSNITRYEWDYGDSTGIGLGTATAHNYTEAGNFDIKLKVTTRAGCVDSIIKEDYVNISGPQTDLVILGINEGCKPLDICFDMQNTSNLDTFMIFYGDGDYGTDLCHTYTSTGENILPTIILEKTEDGELCRYTLPAEDTVKIYNIRADFTIESERLGCPPLNASFQSSSTNAVSLEWIMGDSLASDLSTNNVEYIYENPGKYDVTLVATDENDCSDTLTRLAAIDVFYINASFEADTNAGCSPFAITLTQNCSSEVFISNYLWDYGNDTTSINPLPRTVHYQYISPKAFPVSLTITDDNGCIATAYDTIQLNKYPIVDFEVDSTVLCPQVPLGFTNLTDMTTIDSIFWDFQDDTTSSEENPSFPFQQEGWHTISLGAINFSGCTAYQVYEDLVFIRDYPPLTLKNAIQIENGQSAHLKAKGAQYYVWSPSETLSSASVSDPIATPNETTIYHVTTLNEFGCFKSDSVTVIVLNPDTSTLIVPDAFTPNGDGINDEMKVLMYDISRFEFKIYNKWGQRVFMTRSEDDGWNGEFNGVAQPMGLYNYIVVGRDINDQELITKGQFLLIR